MGGGRILVHPHGHAQVHSNKKHHSSSNSSSSDSGGGGGGGKQAKNGVASSKDRPARSWPQGALQVVEAQLGLLSASSAGDEFQERRQEEEEEEEEEQPKGVDQSPSPKRTRWGGDDDDDDRSRVHIDLQPQQQALPYGWEQFLDINTGEVYYIDWSTCKRTCRDPREVARLADDKIRALRQVRNLQQQEHLEQGVSRSHTSSARPAAGAAPSSSSSSSASAVFPPQRHHPCSEDEDDQNEASSSQAQRRGGHENVMVALGCHRCLTYFMLPRQDPVCPSCGARLQVKH